jgi:choline dehydrogenase
MWDYIVVGAGTAGSVLAHELTADGRARVLLLEAGGKPSLAVSMPAGMVKLFKTKCDWAFESEPQAACNGRIVFTPRGKMLGGSANMNAQIHQWGHPADFDGWERLGARGWAWADVAPTFRAMEAWAGAEPDDQSRGRLGPMHIARPAVPHPLATAFVAAARRAGVDGTPGYNGAAYRGAWLAELAHRKGRRFSVYDAYLRPALKRSNLEVRANAQVSHLVFEGRRAVGVFVDGEVLRARRGVVLAAGALGTPQLLMLSGIGPAAQLRRHGIEVRVDSPQVGANLQDHPLSAMKFATRRSDTMKAAETVPQLLRWLAFRSGMLASNGVEAIAFTGIADDQAPDLELLFATLEWRNQALDPPLIHAYSIGISPCAPRSRGAVALRSADWRDPPLIDFGLLTDSEGMDARVMLAGARLARSIAATEPLAGETDGEHPDSADALSDEQLLDYLKSEIQTVYHPCGTCRMGSDAQAPVDPDLGVRGIERLWVVDASVMPAVPRGHPNAAVAMIAKRASERILAGLSDTAAAAPLAAPPLS